MASQLPHLACVALVLGVLSGHTSASNSSAVEAVLGHGALLDLASNSSATEPARGPTEVVPLAASSLRGSLRGTRCICAAADPKVLVCATRYSDALDCFWECEQACAKKGFSVKQCASSLEVPGVTDC